MRPLQEANDNYSNTMSTKKLFTLVFLKRPNAVLLGYKTRGLGKGLWNGFGGKPEQNESLLHCAHREVKEECDVEVKDLKHIGVVKYEVLEKPEIHIVHIFTGVELVGIEKPSEEMNPVKWFDYKNIPFKNMWPDSPEWYPLMLADKFFSAHVIYSNHLIKNSIIKEWETLQHALALGH